MEDSAVEITQAEWKQEKSNLNKDNLRELWENISHTSNHIRGIPKWDSIIFVQLLLNYTKMNTPAF